MRVCLLGSVEVIGSSGSIPMGGVKERLALTMLAIHPNRVVSDWTLVDALWDDSAPASGVKALHHHVHRLRRRFTEAGLAAEQIETRSGGYILHLGREELDVDVAEGLLARGRASFAAGAVEDAARVLASAVDLWRGPPLGDLAERPALLSHARRLSELRLDVIEAFADSELVLGRHATLVPLLEAATAGAASRERLWGLLILALYRNGRQSEALAAFQRCRRSLRDDLGIDPGRELAALDNAILRHSPELDWESPSNPPGAAVVPNAQPTITRVFQSSTLAADAGLVGRDSEIDEARRWWDAADGRRPILLIEGEPGQGKTSLMAAVMAEIEGSGALILVGRCDRDVVVSYRALAEALAPVVDVYEIIRNQPADGPADEIASVTDAVWRALDAARRRVVVVIEDLHWADWGTAEVVRQLARRKLPLTLGLVITARNPEARPSDSGASLVEELHHTPGSHVLPLGPLAEEDVARLIERDAGHQDSDLRGRASMVHERTGGNALFVTELVRHLRDHEIGLVPRSIVSLVATTLAGLPTSVQRVLEIAACTGEVFDAAVVESALGAAVDTDIYELAMRANLITETGRVVGRFQFRHALLREGVDARLSTLRRADLHRRVAIAMRSVYPLRIEEIARHYTAAASPGRAAEATDWALRAAHTALDGLRFQDAAAHAARGLQLAELDDAVSLELRCDLELAALRSAWFARHASSIRDHRRRALALARNLGSWSRFAEAALHQGYHIGESPTPKLELLQQALDALGNDSDELRCRLLSTQSEILLYAGTSVEQLEDVTLEAVSLGRASGRPRVLSEALLARSAVLRAGGRLEECERVCDELVRLGQQEGSWWELEARRHRAWTIRLQVGDRAGFERDLDFVHGESTVDEARSHVRRLQSMLAMVDGRFDDAERLVETALEPVRSDVNAIVLHFGAMTVLAWERGDIATALQGLVAARDVALSVGIDVWIAGLLSELGRDDEARMMLDQLAVDQFAAVPRGFYWPFWSTILATTIARLGAVDLARALRPLIAPFTGQVLVASLGMYAVGAADRFLAMLDMTCGEFDSATRLFAAAVDIESRISGRALVSRTQLWWARCLLTRRSSGDVDEARLLLDSARSTAEQCGQRAVVEEVTLLEVTAAHR